VTVIALESIDAGGKSSNAKLLASRLSEKFPYLDVETFHFPHYESFAGGCVGRILRGDTRIDSDELESYFDKAIIIQSCMLADRLEHIELLQEYYASSQKLLILDRYLLSGIVYGQADGLPRDWIAKIQTTLPKASLTFLIDISVEESFRRKVHREDLYERDRAKLERVRELYLAEERLSSSIMRIDGERDMSAVAEDLFRQTCKLFE